MHRLHYCSAAHLLFLLPILPATWWVPVLLLTHANTPHCYIWFCLPACTTPTYSPALLLGLFSPACLLSPPPCLFSHWFFYLLLTFSLLHTSFTHATHTYTFPSTYFSPACKFLSHCLPCTWHSAAAVFCTPAAVSASRTAHGLCLTHTLLLAPAHCSCTAFSISAYFLYYWFFSGSLVPLRLVSHLLLLHMDIYYILLPTSLGFLPVYLPGFILLLGSLSAVLGPATCLPTTTTRLQCLPAAACTFFS